MNNIYNAKNFSKNKIIFKLFLKIIFIIYTIDMIDY